MRCPKCHLQPIGLSIYSNCQHCGWSLQNSQREIHSNQELILQEIIDQKDRRIAELEAEVERLKKTPEKTLGELFVEKVFSNPVSPEIEQARKNLRRERFSNNVLRFEEGEG